jgi:dolichyl-phosphate beta-glucosyltransferase
MNQSDFLFKNQLVTAFFCSLFAIATALFADSTQTLSRFPEPELPVLTSHVNLAVVIPAYNEENRIEKTLYAYHDYFKKIHNLSIQFLVVCNNCSDKTFEICKNFNKKHKNFTVINLQPGGKGFAVKEGFLHLLQQKNIAFIGFVDADMATTPHYFYELITKLNGYDVAIASRYAAGARVWPSRPRLKRFGGKLYNWLLRKQFHLNVYDTQCGAKIFSYDTVNKVAHHMHETGWAFDLELLYLCQLFDKKIIEVPTTWTDVPGSHLTISGCYKEFIASPNRIKQNQKDLVKKLAQEKRQTKFDAKKQKTTT